MARYVIDTNFFISGFQHNPATYRDFAKILERINVKVFIPTYVKNELRFFVQREIIPHVKVEEIKDVDFQKFIRKISDTTTNLPQKPDLAVIYLAEKIKGTIVSSDIKLLETAELIGLSTLTDSAFVSYVIEEDMDKDSEVFLKELESRLFTAEIRYSVESTNRYDPVKRIRKILDSAISVIRTEYEERLTQVSLADMQEMDGFSIEALQLRELLVEVQSDLTQLEEDFVQGNYKELEGELLTRVREITDHIIDWKLAANIIEDHPTYNEALLLLGRLQYLGCICLIENKKLELARVYMDKLMMILVQGTKEINELSIDVHFLRMILLLLTGQIRRLNSYFTPAFEDKCNQLQRADVFNVIPALILLTVILGGENIVERTNDYDYDNIEFINQLGFKFMQLGELKKASLMFAQTFHLSLNGNNKGLCIACLEYLSWLHFAGLSAAKSEITKLYNLLIKKFPDIKSSYQLQLKLKSSPKELQNFLKSNFTPYSSLSTAHKSSFYCLGTQIVQTKGRSHPLIRTMNWEMMTRVGIADENSELSDKASLGTIIHLVDGNYKFVKASSHFNKKHDVELLMYIDNLSYPTIAFRSTGGWDIKKIEEK
jgi:predicted DNA-binding protein (UPF0278 family)